MSVHHWTGKYHHGDPAATVASLTPTGNDGWQPIETVPLGVNVWLHGVVRGIKTEFSGFVETHDDFTIDYDDGYARYAENTKYPTHWQPLPQPPKETA